jgi:hypothetical protein
VQSLCRNALTPMRPADPVCDLTLAVD